MVMPITDSKGEYIGAYQAINKTNGGSFNEKEDRRSLSLAAVICGLALESDFFSESLNKDNLTGLRTRAGFFSDHSWRYDAAMKDRSRKVVMMMLDIDGLKQITDICGLPASDEALKLTASVLAENSSDKCGVYRWGGDEFFIILLDTDIQTARQKAEEIRTRLEGASFAGCGEDTKLTVSIGAAACDHSLNIAENIRAASKNLSMAKQAGKNTVIC